MARKHESAAARWRRAGYAGSNRTQATVEVSALLRELIETGARVLRDGQVAEGAVPGLVVRGGMVSGRIKRLSDRLTS